MLALPTETRIRITPTCVGNTISPLQAFLLGEDHPHLRGEYPHLASALVSPFGSPPLAWGILVDGLTKNACEGITPTCVGNTGLRVRYFAN